MEWYFYQSIPQSEFSFSFKDMTIAFTFRHDFIRVAHTLGSVTDLL